MGMYSKDEVLDKFIEQVYIELLANGHIVNPDTFKEIGYGVSFKSSKGNEKKDTNVAIYHSPKKGFSVVTKDPNLKKLILSLLMETGSAGSDEAGKGDIFGPLVVSSFYIGSKDLDILKLNIKDSKNMKNEEVLSFYKEIIMDYSSNFATVRIMPEKYNSLYGDLKSKGKNLNHLLAWAHGRAIENLKTKKSEIKKVIIDQFSSNAEIKGTIQKLANGIELEFQTKAEKNQVVAAASIMARGEYLFSLQKISSELLNNKVKLSSGSGAEADEKLKFIKANFSDDIFKKIAKMHFSNFSRI